MRIALLHMNIILVDNHLVKGTQALLVCLVTHYDFIYRRLAVMVKLWVSAGFLKNSSVFRGQRAIDLRCFPRNCKPYSFSISPIRQVRRNFNRHKVLKGFIKGLGDKEILAFVR